MTQQYVLERVREILTDSSISHIAIRCDRALQLIDKSLKDMSASEYLDYLIDTAKLHESGGTTIGVKATELNTLKVLIASERLQQQTLARNKNGNPA
jgi:hypothetical protein